MKIIYVLNGLVLLFLAFYTYDTNLVPYQMGKRKAKTKKERNIYVAISLILALAFFIAVIF
jgi:hypothetical protein